MAPFARTTLPAHLKHPAQGRPTEYRPEYDQLVIETMAAGHSLAGFAGIIRVARDTVYEWIKTHASFSDAVNRARSAQITAWERRLIAANSGAEAASAIFALKNVAPDTWREVREVKHEHTLTKAEQLTDAQLHAIASQKARPNGTVIDGEVVRSDTD